MIPYSRQLIDQSDIEAVVEVLQSDYLTQGTQVPAFEKGLCDHTGSKYGVAVNSGTSALHIACLSLNLGAGDYLWTTPLTFVASANCARYCNAQIDFVDIEKGSWNIDVQSLSDKLETAKRENRLPKILVVVHFAGLPVKLEEIHQLSLLYGFHVVEDACHALGASYQESPIGSCRYSDITVFSFHPVKSITTGEGGMAVTNDQSLASKMRLASSHGITRNQEQMDRDSEGAWYYQQVSLGFNYRMSDIHAALGISQLAKLDRFIANRKKIAGAYNDKLPALSLKIQETSKDVQSAHHLYPVRLEDDGYDRKLIYDKLREKGIGVQVHYIPVHLQPYYRKMGFVPGDFPVAESFYKKCLSLPCYPSLSDSDQAYIIDELTKILN